MHAIEIDAVHKQYGDLHALKGLSFAVEQGEFFALLGPNGAGKSTLINSMAGLVRPSSGHIRIQGCDVVADYRQARRQIGVVPQEIVFDPFFTVREALNLQLGYMGLKKREHAAWLDELLETLDLSGKADSRVKSLSGGMKRRVLIAQALVHRPPVVVLDEPTAGVDVELRQTLWAFANRLHQEGHTIVLTTHYLEEAESLCERIAIINQGQLQALETKADLMRRHPYRFLDVLVEQGSQLPSNLASKRVQNEGQRWRFKLHKQDDSMTAVLEQLKLASVVVQDIETHSPGLEEVFVEMTQRKGQEMNSVGFSTLLYKECRRFLRVAVQTLLTPMITSILYLAVFAQVLSGRVEVYAGVSYLQFLVPGLVMMTVIQNAYANTSSSLGQSKMNGSIAFLLVSPISSLEIFAAFIFAAILRGLLAGLGVLLVSWLFIDLMVVKPFVVLGFVVLSSALLATLGMIAGIWADQFEQMSMFQNFVIMPLSFLSGVFYSIHSLPPLWAELSHYNPFFYMVDGFRYGFLGQSDISPWHSAAVVAVALVFAASIALCMLHKGYKLRA